MRLPLLVVLGCLLLCGLALLVRWGGVGESDPPETPPTAEVGATAPAPGALSEPGARGEAEDPHPELAALRVEVQELREELVEREARHLAREQEWLELTRALSSLQLPEEVDLPAGPSFLSFQESEPEVEPEPGTGAFEEAQAQARALRARNDLNAMFVAEHVFALDVLELGRVNQGWAGPVVLRQLDDRGRLIGTLAADRLRLEASRAGRSVTLVFEVGWESRGGVRTPFGPPEDAGADRGGTRRVNLPGVDPDPWIEAFPELLRSEALGATPDDGLWNLIELRLVLDERMRTDSPAGRWRLVGLGGVVGGDLLDVHLAELGAGGRVERRLFADTLRIRSRGQGLELLLLDGVIERDGQKSPFLEGSYRLFLPDARRQVWETAGVPGLSDPPR